MVNSMATTTTTMATAPVAAAPRLRRATRNVRRPLFEQRLAKKMEEEWGRRKITSHYDRHNGDYYEKDNTMDEVIPEINSLCQEVIDYWRLDDYLRRTTPLPPSFPSWVVDAIQAFTAWSTASKENKDLVAVMRDIQKSIRYTSPMAVWDSASGSFVFERPSSGPEAISIDDAKREILAGEHPNRRYIQLSFLLDMSKCHLSTSLEEVKERVITAFRELGSKETAYQKSAFYSSLFESQVPIDREQFETRFRAYLYYHAVDGLNTLYNPAVTSVYDERNIGHYHDGDIDRDDPHYGGYDDSGYYGYEDDEENPIPAEAALRAHRELLVEKKKKEEEARRRFAEVAFTAPSSKSRSKYYDFRYHYVPESLDSLANTAIDQVLADVNGVIVAKNTITVIDIFYRWSVPSYYLQAVWVETFNPETKRYEGHRKATPEEVESIYLPDMEIPSNERYTYMYTSSCGTASTTDDRHPASYATKENIPIPPNRVGVDFRATESYRISMLTPNQLPEVMKLAKIVYHADSSTYPPKGYALAW